MAWDANGLLAVPAGAVPPGSDDAAVAATELNIVALRRDGSLTATGWAGSGMTDVPPGNDFVAVSRVGTLSVALRRDGTAAAWLWAGLPEPVPVPARAIAGRSRRRAPTSGSVFAIGTTTVTCTATDGFGNRDSAAFAVVVPRASSCSVKLASRKVVAAHVRLAATRLTR